MNPRGVPGGGLYASSFVGRGVGRTLSPVPLQPVEGDARRTRSRVSARHEEGKPHLHDSGTLEDAAGNVEGQEAATGQVALVGAGKEVGVLVAIGTEVALSVARMDAGGWGIAVAVDAPSGNPGAATEVAVDVAAPPLVKAARPATTNNIQTKAILPNESYLPTLGNVYPNTTIRGNGSTGLACI